MEFVVLELGCGENRRIENAITIDIMEFDSIDIVANLESGLPFIPDNSVDEIHSYHFLEHIDNIEFNDGGISKDF